MNRREFITLLGGAAVWPLAAYAQPERMRRVGVLMGIESDPDARARVAAFRQELRQLGWSEDRDIRIDVIWGAGDADHVRTDAAELIGKSPDVILANGPVPTTELQKATRTIPIVFTQVPDPVDLGIIASLARPGMNITGFTHFELAFGGKWRGAQGNSARHASRRSDITRRASRIAWIPADNHGGSSVWRFGGKHGWRSQCSGGGRRCREPRA